MCCKVDISDPLPPLRTYDILNTKLYLSNIYSPERLWCARCNISITSVKHLKNPSQNLKISGVKKPTGTHSRHSHARTKEKIIFKIQTK